MFKQFFLSTCLFLTTSPAFAEISDSQVCHILSEISDYISVDPFSITSLTGGLTNENYFVVSLGKSFLFRRSAQSHDFLGCSLSKEAAILSLICSTGIAPKLYLYLPKDNILVTEFIRSYNQKVNLQNETTLQKFCGLVRTLHHTPVVFPTEFCPFTCIYSYLREIKNRDIVLPDAFEGEIVPAVNRIEQQYRIMPHHTKCPAHLDLSEENTLTDGERVWIIDWEYGAMADPYFDLATLASVNFYNEEKTERLLTNYLEGRTPTMSEREYFNTMRILADARWCLWCYLQESISPINAPYREFGDMYLNEILKRLFKS